VFAEFSCETQVPFAISGLSLLHYFLIRLRWISYSRASPLKDVHISETSNHTPINMAPIPTTKMLTIKASWMVAGKNMEINITSESVRKHDMPKNNPNSDHLAWRARLKSISSILSTSMSDEVDLDNSRIRSTILPYLV
jgi:hypothetical protein